MKTPRMKAAIYTRVSTNNQAEEGESFTIAGRGCIRYEELFKI
jgi:DNA invertase Pin-like site-specific DNA recombinase